MMWNCKNKILGIRGKHIIALLSYAIAMTSCSNDVFNSDEANQDVTVDMAFSVSSQLHQPSTRLVPEIIQDNTAHRGIQDVYVIPFRATRKIEATDHPTAFQVNGISNYDFDRQAASDAWFYYYEGCSFERGTASFLAYCRATKATDPQNSNSEIANKAYNGSLVTNIAATEPPSETSFALESIVPNNNVPTIAQQLANYLTNIATTMGDYESGGAERVWSRTSEPTLKVLYLSFINQTNEGPFPFAGSGPNVNAHIAALRQLLDGVTVTTPAHQSLLDALKAKVASGLPAELQNYPASIGLPDGAAVLRWNGTAFEVETQTTTLAYINNISRYAYPAELFYYSNSQIYTSSNKIDNTYYSAATEWGSLLNNFEYKTGSIVTTNTQSVALIEPLQYAVACMKINIKATNTTLPDAIGTAIPVESFSFPVTGVIVGGQLPLGFDFKPKAPYSELEARFAYDHHVKDKDGNTIYMRSGSGVSETLSTLVLQSYDEKEVPIVVEFTNNSDKDFIGLNGKIYRGTKFYLAGVIDPAEAAEGAAAEAQGRVFTQDFTTSLTVKVESLAKAYNVLPDMLTPRLEIGIQLVPEWIQSTPTDVQLD